MKKYLLISLMFGSVAANSYAADSIVKADINAGKEKSAVCAACHGVAGVGVMADWPKLAGQHSSYISKQLTDFKSAKRKDPVMSGQAAALSATDVANLAAYFSSQKYVFATAEVTKDAEQTAELLRIGEKLYRGGDLERTIAACASCHGPEGLGLGSATYPAIAGQYSKYLIKQLKAFRTDISQQDSTVDVNTIVYRDNDPSKMMRDTARQLTDKEIQAVAYYIQGLQP